MGKFFLGVAVALCVLGLGGLGGALLGFFPTAANTAPPKMERHLAMSALDASMERHAPHVKSPVAASDDNLIEGMKLYTMNCAECHGGLDRKPAAMAKSFYPPAPDLILDPPDDDPEWHVYYAIRTGVRYTGMPSWEKVLSENDMWKITAFLTRVNKLPPAAQEYWKKTSGVEPPTGSHEGHEAHD
jgi:thiosulfate dehydrogenase